MLKQTADQISSETAERKYSGESSLSATRADDCEKVSLSQSSETVSFLASRLPTLEKLDSILEQQV